jgi:hypothetical protein
MKKYTDDVLEQNYNTFIEAIKTSFKGDRLDKLLFMYSMDELGPNLLLSPASSTKNFHNAYDGGYIDHVVNVARNALRMMRMYRDVGGCVDFTEEELLFTAFHHDLGKLGQKGELHYIKNDSQWHVEKQGKIYKSNPDITPLNHTDRTIFLLNQYGIAYNEKEFLGIKLTDGLFDDDNKKYLITYDPEKGISKTTNLGHIIHWADHMSTCVERDVETGRV